MLERLAHEQRNFLVRTSVLRQMNADLCDALLDRDDSAARLAELERANLFLRSVGGDWYRYHAAFCDALLEGRTENAPEPRFDRRESRRRSRDQNRQQTEKAPPAIMAHSAEVGRGLSTGGK